MTAGLRIEDALRLARVLMDTTGIDAPGAAANPAIPLALRDEVARRLLEEGVIEIRDPRMIEDRRRRHHDWLRSVDRADWYYWPRMREHLIDRVGRPENVVRAIDRATDRILGAMESPAGSDGFRTQGLVVGHVQSGKTANYSALIGKAADCGYRLVIVLTGIHNSLRQQTQRRLTAELVGLDDGVRVGVGPPPAGRQWQTFTSSGLNGDFNPGNASPTALVGTNPVLIVAKKWVSVLRAMNEWFDRAPTDVLRGLPVLIIDDEADQASPNTGGDRPADVEEGADQLDETAPSTTNAFIRRLVGRFDRTAYVAYTATPFANVLIDHEAIDRVAGEDLYPRSFIVDLPRPPGYYGAERIFGLSDDDIGERDVDAIGMDVIRRVPDEDVPILVPARRAEVEGFEPALPDSLTEAIDAFVLAGAARIQRGADDESASMLVHTSYRTPIQARLTELVDQRIERDRDEWRYVRERGIERRLRDLWDRDFRPVVRAEHIGRDVSFETLNDSVGRFYEQLQVRQINSGSLDELDYEREPDIKVIVVGGNRLSRGLTLEGLLVSYYVRPARNYDTLLQMGRWFGFRDGYADLTRIYTTEQLERWFQDLATVELEVRGDIRRYEAEGLTPIEFGVRIRRHPAMAVTSPLKMQHAQVRDLSFNDKFRQTINFRFDDLDWLRENLDVTRAFLTSLGPAEYWREGQPMWRGVDRDRILGFLGEYQMDPDATLMRARPLREYIRRQGEQGELTDWVIAVMGQRRRERRLGSPLDLGIVGPDGPVEVNPIERTRIRGFRTLKAIASGPDQGVGLSEEQRAQAQAGAVGSLGERLRHARPPREGLLLLYPISRHSGHGRELVADADSGRVPIFDDAESGVDVIGLAVAFPRSGSVAVREYITGTVRSEDE